MLCLPVLRVGVFLLGGVGVFLGLRHREVCRGVLRRLLLLL
jgi:hypothetical protein